MNLLVFTLTLTSTRPIHESGAQLRGFFATKFNEYSLLHQHNADKFIYRYPMVQYKMIDKIPTVIGINEGAEVLKEIYDEYDKITLSGNEYEIVERGITYRKEDFGISEKLIKYDFVTPWFALNQENYRKYLSFDKEQQVELLNKNLVGNILSMSKSLNYQVPEKIKCHTELRERSSSLKGNEIIVFRGSFVTNFQIPDYLGLGKSVSRGFGTVRKWAAEINKT
ncbi:CRISPR-associated endonuclease Cas6 [Methanomethylovorans sp.]|uniref:CRISPR-associated endonuclease Cas6 n=2 Tax=Methanomethylovorans sp. TaxID=2758717 RepID=UPI000A5E0AD3|nr:CRISPR-associated endonuclease Cas6 [Methanomethylovorans sp.]